MIREVALAQRLCLLVHSWLAHAPFERFVGRVARIAPRVGHGVQRGGRVQHAHLFARRQAQTGHGQIVRANGHLEDLSRATHEQLTARNLVRGGALQFIGIHHAIEVTAPVRGEDLSARG